ncbi:MAG TPA: nucleotidyltransferase family protein, partial [Thermotogota bacterium]|nr:nucleotidyltransferase family protein [Thermotogota bacterium]
KTQIFEFLNLNKSTLKKYGVKKIGLFGSFVTGKATAKSDIDILVEFDAGKKTFDNYMDLKFFIEDNLNRKVDLVIEKNIKQELKDEILGSVRYA